MGKGLPTTIDANLAADPDLVLLGLLIAGNKYVEAIHIRNIIYLPAPFVGVFL